MASHVPSQDVAPRPARLTQKFALLVTPEMHQELHRQAGKEMTSVGELVRRFIDEGLERLEDEGRK